MLPDGRRVVKQISTRVQENLDESPPLFAWIAPLGVVKVARLASLQTNLA